MNELFNATSCKVSLFTSCFLQEKSWTRTPIQPPSWIFNYYTVSHSVIIVRGDIILSSKDFCTDFLHKIYVKKRFQWYCLSFVVLINLELCLFVFFSVCFQIKGTKQSQAFQFSDRTQQHYEVGLFCLSVWINPRVYVIWMCVVIIL